MKQISDYKALARMTLKNKYGKSLAACLIVLLAGTLTSGLIGMFTRENSIISLALNLIINLLISLILLMPLNVGLSRYFLKQASGEDNLEGLTYPFKSNHTNIVKVSFIKQLKLTLILIISLILAAAVICGGTYLVFTSKGIDVFSELKSLVYYMQLGDSFELSDDSIIVLIGLITVLYSTIIIAYIPVLIKSIEYMPIDFILAEHPEIKSKDAFRAAKLMMKKRRGKYFLLMLSFIGWFLLGACAFGFGIILVMPYVNATAAQFYIDVKYSSGASAIIENAPTAEL